MIDRINELLLDLEAFHFKLDPDSNRYKAHLYIEDLNYLITLIVEECIRHFSEDYQRDFDTKWREDLSKSIKQHFGVEE
jgi:hypothetical protein